MVGLAPTANNTKLINTQKLGIKEGYYQDGTTETERNRNKTGVLVRTFGPLTVRVFSLRKTW